MTKKEDNKKLTDKSTAEYEKWIHNWISYLEEMRFSYLADIGDKSLSEEHVYAYIRHLPIEEFNNEWPNEVYKITKMMIQELYEYSKEMGFISENMSFEEFIK